MVAKSSTQRNQRKPAGRYVAIVCVANSSFPHTGLGGREQDSIMSRLLKKGLTNILKALL